MNTTHAGQRLHIGLYGRRNAGKSSLINALSGHEVALVSPVAGTTTDPVSRPMELPPLGPVVLIDTAGLDDEGELGLLRVSRSREMLDRTDLAIVVVEGGAQVGEFEEGLIADLKSRSVAAVGAVNKADLNEAGAAAMATELTARFGIPFVPVTAAKGRAGVTLLHQAVIANAPVSQTETTLLADLVHAGDVVLLVTPVDSGAPKGRLILPQVEAIRDLLDHRAISVVVTDTELPAALAALKAPPALVVTDSQVFGPVDAALPPDVPLTSFSILMARHKGDLAELVRGARAIESLRPGDRVLIAETCTHHQQKDDIGTVKIPRWLQKHVGGDLQIDFAHGPNMPAHLTDYKLVIHCGGCMINRQLMMTRIRKAQAVEVPIVNYGVAIAYLHGILPRAISPFDDLVEV
jgi:[FeFe] hydrogenase H-cluster maturation GTPase HydF